MEIRKLSPIEFVLIFIAIITIPIILIFALNKGIIKLAFIPIDFSAEIKLSEYITMYISILSIEITALLTLLLYYLSVSKENEKNIKLARKKAEIFIADLNNILQYFYVKYLSALFPNYTFLEKHISFNIDKDFFNDLNNSIDKKYIDTYIELYDLITNILILIDKGNNVENNLNDIIKKITVDAYYYYRFQLGTDIKIKEILKEKYIDAINQLAIFSKTECIDMNNNKLYIKNDNQYTVFNKSREILCNCTFNNSTPNTGFAKLFKNNKLYYEGTIENGIEVIGTFYNCIIDDNNNVIIICDNRPEIICNFSAIDDPCYNKISGKICRIADFKLENDEYTIISKIKEVKAYWY